MILEAKTIYLITFYYFYNECTNAIFSSSYKYKNIMLVQFQVIYKTHIGQHLVIVGSIPELGNGSQPDAQIMTLKDALTGL